MPSSARQQEHHLSPAKATATVPYVVEDCFGVVQLLSDGTVVRFGPRPFPAGDRYDDGGVEWKDAVYDAKHNLGVRIYKPRRGKAGHLPMLVYFHGGGFCFGSYSWPKNHVGCLRLAAELPAIVLSFDYRLAPEHRLPAAVDDATAALLWLPVCISSDPWLATANASRLQVFVGGISSGANLVHHVLVRIGSGDLGLGVKIAGYILLMPPFLSEEPTRSELEAPATALLSREASDKYFRLGLPVGANKDDPLVNPFGPASPSLETVEVGRMLMVAAECDLVRDKNVEYAERMKAMGKDVELVVFAGEEHAFFATKPLSPGADLLLPLISRFIHQK